MSYRILFAGAALAAAACASARSAAPASGAPSAAAPPPAVAPASPPSATAPGRRPSPGSDPIRLGPSVLHYEIERHIDIHQEVLGQASSSQLAYRVYATAAIHGPADSAGYPTTFTVDSIVPDSGTTLPGTINLAAARGLTFTGTLGPDGELRNATPSDSLVAQALTQLVGTFRDFYPRIPAAGLTLGRTWTDTVSRADRSGAIDKLLITAITTSHAGAIVERNGAHSLQIESTSSITVSGSGALGGQPITLQGTGSRRGIEFVAVDGRYLGGESLDSTQLTFTFPGQTVPQRLVSHALVKVLP
jgi:hypothetical protein